MNKPQLGTQEYFAEEVVAYLNLLGQKSFWDLDEAHRDGALTGLLHAYGKIKGEVNTEDVRKMRFCQEEYSRRAVALILAGMLDD